MRRGRERLAAAIPCFVSFQIIGAFVFLNLVVAIMIESFTELGEGRTTRSRLSTPGRR